MVKCSQATLYLTISAIMPISLSHLLSYKNAKLLARYRQDFPHAAMSAEEALTELLKFIWLCHQHRAAKQAQPQDYALQFSCVMHTEMQDIDCMWHSFLLFTKEYHAFCDDYLGGDFFHHEPLDNDLAVNEADYEEELTRYLSYIYDHLGEETLVKWFNP